MMKLKTALISLTTLCIPFAIQAQLSGNIVYGQNNSIEKKRSLDKLYLTDSTFLVEAAVMENIIADQYVVTFGVSEEAATVSACNEKIEKRIQSFISDLKKMGHSESDIYVDMTTQNKVFAYITKGNVAEQYLKGFEIKKNVIIKLKSLKSLDNIVISASTYQIYDLVKVDYIVTDMAKVYSRLFQSAAEIINQKKALYAGLTNMKISSTAQIYGEDFYSYYPSQLYKTYTAHESSEVYYDYHNFTKKDLRKETTFYYDKLNYSGFDKVINPVVTEPAVECVLTLQVKYQIDKPKK